MKKVEVLGIPTLWGIGYAAGIVLLSRLLLQQLGNLLGLFGAGAQVAQALGQLKQAAILSPWLLPLLAGALLGGFMGLFKNTRLRRWVSSLGAALLLLPGLLAVICFTRVNGIGVMKIPSQLSLKKPKLPQRM